MRERPRWARKTGLVKAAVSDELMCGWIVVGGWCWFVRMVLVSVKMGDGR